MDQKKPIFGFFTLLLKTHPEKRKLLDFGKNRAKKKKTPSQFPSPSSVLGVLSVGAVGLRTAERKGIVRHSG